MSRAGHSKLDQQIIDAADEHHVVISERQLDTWRGEGVVPPPDRHGLGRGKGVTTSYPPEVIAYIIELGRAAAAHAKPLREVVAWLVLQGVDVPEQSIRSAYLAILKAEVGQAHREATEDESWEHAAQFADLATTNKTSESIRDFRRAIRANYDDLTAEKHWDNPHLELDKPNLQQHRRTALHDLYLAATRPDLLADVDSYHVLARTFLDHGILSALPDIGHEELDTDELLRGRADRSLGL